MIKFENEYGKVNLELHGSLREICADVTMCIAVVYEKLKESDKKTSEIFKELIQDCVKDGIPFIEIKLPETPETKEEKEKEGEKEYEAEEIIDLLKKLLKSL